MSSLKDNLYESFILYDEEDSNRISDKYDDDNYSTISSEFAGQVKIINSNLKHSLENNRNKGDNNNINNDDTISLYAYENEEEAMAKQRMTWEEW